LGREEMMAYTAAKKLRKYDQASPPGEAKKDWGQREELAIKYAPLIKTVAGRLAMRLPPHVDQDDLLSAGVMGLLDAIEKFDPEKGVAFKSYAEFRIRGAMLDELRAMDWVPRSVRKNAKRLEEAYGNVERRKMGPATDDEVAKELDVDLESFHKLLEQTRGTSIISEEEVGELISHKQVGSLWPLAGDNGSSDPMTALDLVELRDLLAQAIEGLPQNERLVVTLYYYEELTMKEIGAAMGYTESRISQLHTKAVMRLRSRIKKYFDPELRA
jgi:RNA polymerase sigma factor for flagellar operon FliA